MSNSNKKWSQEDLEDFKNARDQILEAAETIKTLLRQNATRHDYEAAKAYWLGSILAAVDNGEYVERNTMLAFMESKLGYDSEEETFPPEEEEEEEETED